MKKGLIIAGIVIVVIVGIIGILVVRGKAAINEVYANLETVEITRGTLSASIGATGTVRANQTASLTWQTSGSVDVVNVKMGDEVSRGDIIATLSRDSLSQSVILAQADLVASQKALDDLYDGYSDLMVAQAEQAVAAAQDMMETYETRLSNLQSPANQTDIDQAEANLTLYENALEQAKEDYEPYENKPDSDVKATYKSRLAQAQKNYDNASRYLNNLLGSASQTDLSVAQSNLDVSQQQLLEAEKNYQDILAGPKPDDIAAAEARIEAAQATLAMAYIDIPFDGVVTMAAPKPGDQVSPGQVAFRIDDLSRLLVDVNISEVDINSIQVGQDATLVFDALWGQEFNAKVIEVSPVGTEIQGAVNFTVTLELTDDVEEIRPGMTAAVTIVTQEIEDILLVPNRAIKRNYDGDRIVYIINDSGVLLPVVIELGSTADMYSEVLGNSLKVGDEVVLNPPAAFNESVFGGS